LTITYTVAAWIALFLSLGSLGIIRIFHEVRLIRIAITRLLIVGLAVAVVIAQQKTAAPKPGVVDVQVPFASLTPSATFKIGRTADWVLVTDDSVWVVCTKPNALQRIDPATSKVVAKVALPGEACSGNAFGFGSIWVPICSKRPSLARVDILTNRITNVLPVGPADAEEGITASDDSIWIITDKNGSTLSRIDPATNTVRQEISIPTGSYNPLSSDNIIWITGHDRNILTAVDAASGKVIGSTPVGPRPRFLTSGGGSIWTLNQGDGSVSRVDLNNRNLIATIALGIPGFGGSIGYGADSVWATSFDVPLTVIDPKTNKVLRQWVGPGGDSLSFGHDSVWLSDYHHGLLWRIPVPDDSIAGGTEGQIVEIEMK
jgi:virginiamycin B lyase